ncbi:unnamed protein product [Cuscuta epithymum]|nr:unnamed protein product [Cuscuta epithymum]CAH9132473.1 unnamed protein product [Cuscuta epithymum]
MFIDLDCRFDILSLSRSLKQRVLDAIGKSMQSLKGGADVTSENDLVIESMRRFMYVRCYDSIQFLATLKTMHNQLQKGKEVHGVGAYLLIIDSIGAFHWMDRALAFIPHGSSNRKSLSLQGVSEAVVQAIQKILLAHPMLVLCTKTVNMEDKYTSNEVVRNVERWNNQNLPYREYMPLVWQSFVSHRMLVYTSDDNCKNKSRPTYFIEWLLPSLHKPERMVYFLHD